MSKPEDTAKTIHQDYPAFLLDAAQNGNLERSITSQEARGQEQLVQSTALPMDGMTDEFKAVIEIAGGKVGVIFRDDPLFMEATLPPGWEKRPTDHSSWTDLLDEMGRKRASIYYKAAFYDRKSHLHVIRRYGWTMDYDVPHSETESPTFAATKDEEIIQRFPPVTYDFNDHEQAFQTRRRCHEKAERSAQDWLDANYPEWRDIAAYWDED